MSQEPGADVRREFEELSRRLAGPLSAAERDVVKGGIIALFHRTERLLEELTSFKESIRDLIASYKALPPVDGAPPRPQSAGGGARGMRGSVRHDHIGASTYVERGWSAIASRRWPEAEAHLRRAVELDETSTGAQALLAWVLMAQGAPAAGRVLCEEILADVPEHGMALAVLGAIWVREGEGVTGMALLRQATRPGAEPRAVLYARYWLGVTLLEREEFAAAERELRQAVALGPNLAEGWLALGLAVWAQGQPREAGEAWLRGSRIRHSTVAAVCQQALETVAAGGEPTRSPLW